MKRCPECRRDYHDDSLLYCLDDGTALLDGPASAPGREEPQTAILRGVDRSGESPTTAQINSTDQTAISHSGPPAAPKAAVDKRLVGISFLVAVIVVTAGVLGYRYYSPTKPINSIAVLAFENRSGNADSDYLSDGLTESLIYRLSQLPDLKVSPTSSILRYKGKDTDLQKIASELGVQAIMSGRIAQRGDNLTISVELVDAANNKLLWGEQYERKISELLATQREIATEITNKLKVRLTGVDAAKAEKKYTDNNDAYQLYLRGRFYFAKRGKDNLLKGIDYYQHAIALDPNFALAYVGVAESYNLAVSNSNLSPQEAMPLAEAAVRRALEIDRSLAEAHAAHATSLIANWNWSDAEREYKRALELDPNAAETHYRYAINYLITVGRSDEAIAEIKRALELEPLSLAMNANLTSAYLAHRQPDLALEQAQKAYNLDPNHLSARLWLGLAYIGNARYDDAIALDEKILQVDPTDPDILYTVGYAYGRSGRRNEAEAVIRKLKDIAQTQYVDLTSIAAVYTGLNKRDEAFAELEKAFDSRSPTLAATLADPLLDPLRDDPRFNDLLRRMNLPE
ncbi:MAG TPA: tetratricopeptide repeat protein [Pyrinomonadaceae bacterium]|jgi:TolB-like protein/Flp pilus assembly protein TadD|nr:tetratricopeptide repeat protein [Pyrinomonadaceae bacterium]